MITTDEFILTAEVLHLRNIVGKFKDYFYINQPTNQLTN